MQLANNLRQAWILKISISTILAITALFFVYPRLTVVSPEMETDAHLGENVWTYPSSQPSSDEVHSASRAKNLVALSPERTIAYYSNVPDTIVALDIRSGEPLWKLELPLVEKPARDNGIPVSPGIHRLAVHRNGDVYALDVVQNKVFIIGPKGVRDALPFDPPQMFFLTTPDFQFAADGTVLFATADTLYWTKDHKLERKLVMPEENRPVRNMALSPNTKKLYVINGEGSASSPSYVEAYETDTGHKLWSYKNATYPLFRDLTVDGSGDLFLSATSETVLNRWMGIGTDIPPIQEADSEIGGELIRLSEKGEVRWTSPVTGTHLLGKVIPMQDESVIYLFGETFIEDNLGAHNIDAIFAIDYGGKPIWNTRQTKISFGEGWLFSEQAMQTINGKILVGGEGSKLYVLDAKSGTPLHSLGLTTEDIDPYVATNFMAEIKGVSPDSLLMTVPVPVPVPGQETKNIIMTKLVKVRTVP